MEGSPSSIVPRRGHSLKAALAYRLRVREASRLRSGPKKDELEVIEEPKQFKLKHITEEQLQESQEQSSNQLSPGRSHDQPMTRTTILALPTELIEQIGNVLFYSLRECKLLCSIAGLNDLLHFFCAHPRFRTEKLRRVLAAAYRAQARQQYDWNLLDLLQNTRLLKLWPMLFDVAEEDRQHWTRGDGALIAFILTQYLHPRTLRMKRRSWDSVPDAYPNQYAAILLNLRCTNLRSLHVRLPNENGGELIATCIANNDNLKVVEVTIPAASFSRYGGWAKVFDELALRHARLPYLQVCSGESLILFWVPHPVPGLARRDTISFSGGAGMAPSLYEDWSLIRRENVAGYDRMHLSVAKGHARSLAWLQREFDGKLYPTLNIC